jgi:hypothetical protein
VSVLSGTLASEIAWGCVQICSVSKCKVRFAPAAETHLVDSQEQVLRTECDHPPPCPPSSPRCKLRTRLVQEAACAVRREAERSVGDSRPAEISTDDWPIEQKLQQLIQSCTHDSKFSKFI